MLFKKKTYRDDVRVDGPTGYWPLNEPSGTVAYDVSGNGNNGTYVNSPTLNQTGPIKEDKAINKITTSYVSLTSPISFTADFTLEAWTFFTSTPSNTSSIFGINGTGNDTNFAAANYSLYAPGDIIVSPYAPTLNTWQHWVISRSGTNVFMYLNGTLITTATGYSATFTISALGSGAQNAVGAFSLAQIAVYQKCLTANRILSHFLTSNNGPNLPPDYGHLINWWSPTIGFDGSTTWTDRISALSLTGTGQPASTLQLHGKPLVRSGNANTNLATAFAFSTPVSVYYIGQPEGNSYHGASTSARLLTGNNNNWLLGWFNGGQNAAYFEGWVHIPTLASDLQPHIYSCSLTGSISAAYGDGTLIAQNTGGLDAPLGLAIGGTGAYAEWSDSYYGDLLVYNVAHDQTTAMAIQSWLNRHYLNGSYYNNVILSDNPLIYYRLGETNGTTAVDSSGNGNNGTYTGGYTLNQAGIINHDPDPCVLFDGSTGYITGPTVGLLTNWTLECWCYSQTNSQTTDACLIADVYTGVGVNFFLAIEGGNNLKAGFYLAGFFEVTAILPLQQWTHVVATYDGANITLYYNAVVVATTPASTVPQSSATGVHVARSWDLLNTFNGRIDEVAIYGTALSPQHIALHYQAAI